MNRLLFAIGIVTLCAALPASAQMYKWVDADGKVRYSDTPPPSNVKTEKLRIPAHAPSDAGAAPSGSAKSLATQEQAFRKRQADEAKAQQEEARKEAEAHDRAENCRRAKDALANLELGGRQTRINEKGERVFLSDEEIARATAQARQEAASACN